ncbi:MAG: 3-hydroxyacyl-ACP dehydratase FabZ [Candidatus Polarisedimenticolaceae bacterium]|nr:3-hydroxyacyl-ACP dehydratase FabZ [Candidatus Polarisedimenticolaceae bacterium]
MKNGDINRVLELLPHRYPFLLVDRIVEFEKDKTMTALKNVTYNEPFFQGHFPNQKVMPGVLIVEALAQVTGLLALESDPTTAVSDAIYMLVGIDKARFKRPVVPGDQLMLYVEQIAQKQGIVRFSCKAMVDDKLVASANLLCTAREL